MNTQKQILKHSLRTWLYLAIGCLVATYCATVIAEDRASIVTRIADDIRYLASDELEGRGPETAGLQAAADSIRDQFQQLGLKSIAANDSYFQSFQIPIDTRVIGKQTNLVLHGPDGERLELELGKDFQPLAVGGAGEVRADIVFAGYGISAPDLKYDDYADLDVKGKVVLVVRREPQQDDEKSAFQGRKTTTHAFIRNKLELAKRRGAAAVLFVNDPFTTQKAKTDEVVAPTAFGANSLKLPFMQLRQTTVEKMLARSPLALGDQKQLRTVGEIEAEIDVRFQPLSQPLTGWSAELKCGFEEVQADLVNVIGVLEGEGPLANETIVLGAHYDHIGYGGPASRKPGVHAIHNGADDNASGTAAIIELARRYSRRAERPSRRLVFIAFSAEERGLIGSRYYLEHPVVPLSDTIGMFNFDMVGRLRNNELTVYGVGSGAEFSSLLGRVADGSGLKIKEMDRVIASGDHFGFFERGIPVLHFFTGLTSDYHTPEDDFETINVEGVVQTVDLAERFIDAVLQTSERPRLVKATTKPTKSGGMPYLGITPTYANSGAGVQISTVAPDSPAAKGGLKPQDVIIEYGENPINDFPALVKGLRANKPGDKVKIKVSRDQQEVVCAVTLGSPPGS